MKLHIHGNSLRLSVSEADLARLRWEGYLESWMGLGPGKRFTYRLEAGSDDRAMSAVMQDDALTIFIPEDQADAWVTSDEPRFEAMQMIDGEQRLHIIVEKEVGTAAKRASHTVADESGT